MPAPIRDPLVERNTIREFNDDFELAALDAARWPVSTAIISDQAWNPTSGLRATRFTGVQQLTSRTIDLSTATSATITYQFQQTGRGESPDDNNDLILEVETSSGVWVELDRQLGSGPDMTSFSQRRITVPTAALRSEARFRIRSTGDPGFDDWFVDDVWVDATYGSPNWLATVAKSLGDPVTAGVDPSKNSLDFDGINEHVSVPYDAALNPLDFTIEFWAKVEGNAGNWRAAISAFDFSGGDYRGIEIYASPDNQWEVWAGNRTYYSALANGPAITPNQWTHVATTFQRSSGPDVNGVYTGTVRLYINGLLTTSQAGFQYKPNNTRPLHIGAANYTSSVSYPFNGLMDEVRVWNVARSAAQIEQNYRTSVPANSSGLVGYYRFDEGTGSGASDATTPANNGTLVNTPLWSLDTNEQSPILHRDITASRLASLTSINASGQGINDLLGSQYLVNLQSLNLANNNLDDADMSNLLPRRLTSGSQAGELVGLTNLKELNLSQNAGITSIGSFVGFPNLTSLDLEGTNVGVNSLSTLSTLRSLPELTNLELPNQILNPNQNLVTLEGQTTTIPFRVGVVQLDGVNDSVESPLSVSALGLNGSFTASTWVFPTAASTNEIIFGGSQVNIANQSLHMGIRFNKIYMGFWDNDLTGISDVPLNQWSHITYRYDAPTQTQSVFLNGAGNGSRTGAAIFQGTHLLSIGRIGTDYFNGSIDGVRIFNRALSNDEILSNMFDEVPLGGADVTLNYRFNDGTGTSAQDFSSLARPGVLTNGATFANVTNVPWLLSGSSTASGASSPIIFTPADQGVSTLTVLGNRIPLVVRNVAPNIIATPNLNLANSSTGVREGQTISVGAPRVVGNTIEYDVLVNGSVVDKYVVNEPSSADRGDSVARVSVTDPNGQSTDISYRGSLNFSGFGYVETSLEITTAKRNKTMTFETWVRPTTNTGTRFVFDTAGNNGIGWALYQNGSTWWIDTGIGSTQVNTNQAISVNAWQHLALTIDSNRQARLYINGTAVGSAITVALPTVRGKLTIGSDFSGQQSFVGNIDEFRVWDRALTATEVARLDDGAVSNNAANLLGWWSFNEGVGSIVRDRSPRGNDGRIRSVLTPLAATASSFFTADQVVANLINGSGLTVSAPIENSTHTNGFPGGGGSRTFWHSDTGETTPWIEFDLGANYDLSDMLVWQFNAVFIGGDETNRGIRQYDLFAGTTTNPSNQIITDGQLAKASGTNAEGAQRIPLSGLANGVRFIRMRADSNFGGPFTGLSEVRFLGTPNLWNSAIPPVYATTYTAIDNGTYSLSATFDDRDGGADQSQLNFAVNNMAPVITNLNMTGPVGASSTAPVSFGTYSFNTNSTSDVGLLDTRSFLWEVSTNNGQKILTSTGNTFELSPEYAGVYIVRLTATDNDGASTSRSQTLTISPIAVNTPPSVTTQAGTVVTLGSSASSPLAPAGGMVGTTFAVDRTYAWTVQRGATTIATGTSASVNFVPVIAGTYSATLTSRMSFATMVL